MLPTDTDRRGPAGRAPPGDPSPEGGPVELRYLQHQHISPFEIHMQIQYKK